MMKLSNPISQLKRSCISRTFLNKLGWMISGKLKMTMNQWLQIVPMKWMTLIH
jgi:hypothetical protein